MAIAILSLAVLFLHAESITPRDMRIADVGGDDVGLPVRVRGHIHRVDTTAEGNAAIVLLDYEDFATLRVIARPHAIADATQAAPGALVSVVGSVFGSRGAVQVFSEDLGGVTVLAPPSTNLLPLEFVAQNAVRIEGHRVVVRALVGDVRTLEDSRHALLRQGTDSLWAYDPSGWAEEPAVVTGRLYVTSRGRCELFAGPEPSAVEASLAALAACPEIFVGKPVYVRDVTVEPGERLGTTLTLKDLGDGADYRMAAFVRGWDWRPESSWMAVGRLVTLEGTVEYQATEARWRIATNVPPRP
jgi:hypothetical protein